MSTPDERGFNCAPPPLPVWVCVALIGIPTLLFWSAVALAVCGRL